MFMPFFGLVTMPSGLLSDDRFNDEVIRRGGDIITLILILERKPWAPIKRSAIASKDTIVVALVGCEGYEYIKL